MSTPKQNVSTQNSQQPSQGGSVNPLIPFDMTRPYELVKGQITEKTNKEINTFNQYCDSVNPFNAVNAVRDLLNALPEDLLSEKGKKAKETMLKDVLPDLEADLKDRYKNGPLKGKDLADWLYNNLSLHTNSFIVDNKNGFKEEMQKYSQGSEEAKAIEQAQKAFHAKTHLLKDSGSGNQDAQQLRQILADPNNHPHPALVGFSPDDLKNTTYFLNTKRKPLDPKANFENVKAQVLSDLRNTQTRVEFPDETDTFVAEILNLKGSQGFYTDLAFAINPIAHLAAGFSAALTIAGFTSGIFAGIFPFVPTDLTGKLKKFHDKVENFKDKYPRLSGSDTWGSVQWKGYLLLHAAALETYFQKGIHELTLNLAGDEQACLDMATQVYRLAVIMRFPTDNFLVKMPNQEKPVLLSSLIPDAATFKNQHPYPYPKRNENYKPLSEYKKKYADDLTPDTLKLEPQSKQQKQSQQQKMKDEIRRANPNPQNQNPHNLADIQARREPLQQQNQQPLVETSATTRMGRR